MHANQYTPRLMTKSPIRLAQIALNSARKALPKYSCEDSRQDFTQAQLFAILVLKAFFKTDYRGIIQLLKDFSDLRKTLRLETKIPHYSTLCYAEKRLLKKKEHSSFFRKPYLIEPGIWALFEEAKVFDREQSTQRASRHGTPLVTIFSG